MITFYSLFKIIQLLNKNKYQSQLNADSKIKTGIKMNKSMCGLIWLKIAVDSPIIP